MAGTTTNRRRKKKKSKKLLYGRLIALVLFVLLIVTVVGYLISQEIHRRWEARFESNTSVVFLLEDGSVVSNDVIYFDTVKYNQNDLSNFIDRTIGEYNKEHGEGEVQKDSLSIENNVASLILGYKDAKTYADFSGIELYMGTMPDAVKAGYDFQGKYAKIENGKAVECSLSEISSQKDLKVAIIKANTKIQVDGAICYISADNVAGYGKNWIVTKEGCDLLEVGNQQETEETATTDESETDSVDVSVDGNETETEEEETETGTDIIFDFGDSELPPAEDVTYSEVYTYIFYK